jgi:NADH-quinone oxidoreductase subunit N
MAAMTLGSLVPAYAEIAILFAASLILLVDVFLPNRLRGVTYALTQVAILVAALASLVVVQLTGTRPEFAFSEMFVSDPMANALKLFAYIAVSATLVYSRGYLAERGLFKGEFFVLVLFALLGMMVMISANSLLVLYLGLELLSLCLYALVALDRDSKVATEAAMKYFILGALASGLMLYGMSMLYGATGTLQITDIAQSIAGGNANRVLLGFGVVFVVAGLAFKLGAVPFHMWIPDVYQGAPNAMTLLIASAPKLAAFAIAIRLLVNGLLNIAVEWQQMLVILSVLSMAVGNLAAIAQTNYKRMLAYSAIANMGFMLLGLATGVVDGNLYSAVDAYSAAMFYAVTYVLMSLGAFALPMLLSRAGFEAEALDDLRGLNRRSPWYAFLTLLFMFSLAGVPPTVGFYAKFAVIRAAVAADMIWLAVFAVVMSLIGAFYYLRVVKLMYFDEPADSAPLRGDLDLRLLLSVNGLAVLVLGILPDGLMAVCLASIRSLVV